MTTATISDFMTTRIEAISPSSSVQKAEEKLTDKDVRSLVVIDDKDSKVLGLIPERDIVRNVCIYSNVSINSVKVFYPLQLSSPSLIHRQRATDLLIENKIRHLLVVDKEESNKPSVLLPIWILQDSWTAGSEITKTMLILYVIYYVGSKSVVVNEWSSSSDLRGSTVY